MNAYDLYDLIVRSQQGDSKAMLEIVSRFKPLIKKQSQRATIIEREDLEQFLVEKLLILIQQYDLSKVPSTLNLNDTQIRTEIEKKLRHQL